MLVLHPAKELPTMRIAVLEDDRSQAFVLRKCLTVAGHNPVNFELGTSLLEAFKQQKFDVLLLEPWARKCQIGR